MGVVEPLDLAWNLGAGRALGAAGAMLCVIVDELIPESHARGFEREASYALLAGFALMLVPDTSLT